MDGLFDLNGLAAASQSSRHRFLESKFESISHHLPQFFTRAPGRVNIIGVSVFHLTLLHPHSLILILILIRVLGTYRLLWFLSLTGCYRT